MRLCNFSLKGGVYRTTLALNLAGCYARDPSLRVLVNDRDPKAGPARCLTVGRNTVQCRALALPGFDVEITDTPPRLPDNEVIPEADLYLVPTLLDGASFLIFLRTVDVLEKKESVTCPSPTGPTRAGSPSPPPRAPQDVGRRPGAGPSVVCGLLRGGKDRVRRQRPLGPGGPGGDPRPGCPDARYLGRWCRPEGCGMMELPLVSLPDLPMATRKAPAKKAAKKKAVKRTLDDVRT